jgi:hypothetical protein
MIGPSVVTVNGEPLIDHPLTITTTGEYQIDLVSPDTNHYDPVVVLLRDGVEAPDAPPAGCYRGLGAR